LSNLYAERLKSKHGNLDDRTKLILEVFIPSFSVSALLAVTIYVLFDAIRIIRSHGEDDDVNVYFLWAFSIGNFVVDVLSSLMFYFRGKDALVTSSPHAPLRTFSLDRRSFDMGKRNFFAPVPTTDNVVVVPNLNMLSALTHVGGDTLRTLSVFTAAVISTAGGFKGSLCDAWASVVVSVSIIICVLPLCNEIYKAATTTNSSE
jgi:Co/Zn/Cd efflux system component